MKPPRNRMLRHLEITIEAGLVLGAFALALAAPGPLLVKLLVSGMILLAASWVVVWHLGYRSGLRRYRPPRAARPGR